MQISGSIFGVHFKAQKLLTEILNESDPNIKALGISALVSELFRNSGFDPIVVGGSAIEFYTDGAYMSGDIDICFRGIKSPSPREKADIMDGVLGATGSVRTWKVGDVFVDLLGTVEAFADNSFQSLKTPDGSIVLQPPEDLLVERVFEARGWTQPSPEGEDCARKMMRAVLDEAIPFDWKEAERIADLPAYRCLDHLLAMKDDVLKKDE